MMKELMAVALVMGAAGAAQAENRVENVVLGQYYPSGNVYVARVISSDDKSYHQPDYFHTMTFVGHPVGDKSLLAAGTYWKETGVKTSPAWIEGTTKDEESTCNWGPRSHKNVPYAPADSEYGDFFRQGMPDSCDISPGYGVYRVATRTSTSVPVFGLPDVLSMTLTPAKPETPRPMSEQDKASVTNYKNEMLADYKTIFGKAYTVGDEDEVSCDFYGNTLEDAQQLYTVTTTVPGESFRVSAWSKVSLHCTLYETYVVDQLQDGKVVKTLETSQLKGGL